MHFQEEKAEVSGDGKVMFVKCLTFHVLKLKLDRAFAFYMAYNSLNLNDCILQVRYL